MYTWYKLSENDEISEVGGDWNAFALANDGEGVDASDVIGRSVWDFIHGDEARTRFLSTLYTCRTFGEPLTLTIDCSSNDVPRILRMKVGIEPDGTLLVEHRLID